MRWVVGERRGKERRGGVKKREAIYFHQEGVALESVGDGGKGCCLVCGAGAASYAACVQMGVVWWVFHCVKK